MKNLNNLINKLEQLNKNLIYEDNLYYISFYFDLIFYDSIEVIRELNKSYVISIINNKIVITIYK